MRNSARGKLQPPGRSLRADCSVPLGRQQSWVIEHMRNMRFHAAEAQSRIGTNYRAPHWRSAGRDEPPPAWSAEPKPRWVAPAGFSYLEPCICRSTGFSRTSPSNGPAYTVATAAFARALGILAIQRVRGMARFRPTKKRAGQRVRWPLKKALRSTAAFATRRASKPSF